jgi:integrase
MRLAINANTFNPLDYTKSSINDRIFRHQADSWIEQKEEEVEAGEISPETVKDYKGYRNNYFSYFDTINVREITFEQLENFKDSLPHKLKIKTRRNILNALHSLFVRMHRKGVIKDIPAWPVIEGDDSFVRSALTYGEQVEGLARIPEQDRDVIEFGFETGLRPGETCALKVKDYDELNRQILVRRTWSGRVLSERTKGKNKVWLPLSNRATEIIKLHIKNALPEAFIFINPRTGSAYRTKVLNRLWKQYSGYQDIDHYSASRHSFCTQLIHDGVNPLEAQVAMRHKDLKSTQKYFHARKDKMREHFNNRGRTEKGNERETRIIGTD